MKILIDYFCASLKMSDPVFFEKFFLFDRVECVEIKGKYGYRRGLHYNSMTLYLDGEGVCVELSGRGCRTFETLYKNAYGFDLNWEKLLLVFGSLDSVHISRLDVACDDKSGLLNIVKIIKYTRLRKYVSRARYCVFFDGSEQSVIFGSPSSDTRLRIYNKALERKVEGSWVRVEFQLRNDSAYSFIENLRCREQIGLTWSGVLLNYLRYTVDKPDVENCNYNRVDTVGWWSKFLNTTERIKCFYPGGVEYNLDTLERFLITQVSASLKTYVFACGGDYTNLLQFIDQANFSLRQRQLLRQLGISI